MRPTHTIPPLSPANAASTSLGIDTPGGFSISENVVSEEAWEEIRLYLGLSTFPHRFDEQTCESERHPSIEIDGFGGFDRDTHVNQEGCGSPASIAATATEIPWESTPFPQNRPVAQFGFRYDYEKDVLVPPTSRDDENDNDDSRRSVPKIPEVFQRLLLRPYQNSVETELKSVEFTQCIVNVYRPDIIITITDESKSFETKTTATTTKTCTSSIPWHFDDPQFGPEILVFTFGETRPLHMRLKHEIDDSNETAGDEIKSTGIDDNFSYFTAHPSHRSCYVLSGPARHKWQHSVPPGSSWRVSITFRTLCTQ